MSRRDKAKGGASLSELERARAHLRTAQENLAFMRIGAWPDEHAEEAVLAALSWVWEEQNNEYYRECEGMCPCEAELFMSGHK
jgi:hypothetical protein